jgi:hypothetical protein
MQRHGSLAAGFLEKREQRPAQLGEFDSAAVGCLITALSAVFAAPF